MVSALRLRQDRAGHSANETPPVTLPPDPVRFDICVAEGFVLTEFAAVTDMLRIANRVAGRTVFAWTVRSVGGGTVASSSLASVGTEPFPQRPDSAQFVVIGNSDQNNPALSIGTQLRLYTARNIPVLLLSEAAARFIAEDDARAPGLTTHWENSAVLREASVRHLPAGALATSAGGITTAAGMGSTIDTMFTLVRPHLPRAALMQVANIFLLERIRDPDTRQPFYGVTGTGSGDALVDRAVAVMQEHLEMPLTVRALADRLEVSPRALERRFKTVLDQPPSRYHRELRLAHADNLLLNTSLGILEIGLACGLGEQLTRLYRRRFGMTPSQRRRQRMA